MENQAFSRILKIFSTREELDASVEYLTKQMQPIVREGESVLICFPRENETDLGNMLEKAVLRCGGVPVFWEDDLRWKELLRISFVSKASTIIGPPLVILGLSKVAAFEGIPLYIYNAVMAGYPCLDWMMDGVEQGLDCKIWGIYGPGIYSVLSGFSCDCGRGVHIRDDKFGVEIIDENGNELPDGKHGRIVIYPLREPECRFESRAFASVMTQMCPCGNPAPKLVGVDVEDRWQSARLKIAEDLLYWNSILDCMITRTEYGLELEVVCFRGEKMPKLPSCAKLTVRTWNPETDIPMSLSAGWSTP